MKRTLILTLGVGNLLDKGKQNDGETEKEESPKEKIRRMIDQGKYPYNKTEYIVEIPGAHCKEAVQSEYVAEIQIKEYQPDMVIIIGTVKSGWSMFYSKFTKEEDKDVLYRDVMELYEIEQSYGKDTDNKTLKELEKQIQQIYQSKLMLSGEKPIEIKICLIRYGINSEQLADNYCNISGIEEYLDPLEEYEVAFDITHSFRSLPINNLIILNYLQQVSSYNMKFTHIFYGNYDVKNENNGKAPLVDLGDMITVLNLTNGVSEFKNTGNAASLIKMLPEQQESELKNALEKFDWATQVNGRNNVVNSLEELAAVLNKKTEEQNQYVDVRRMLKTVLGAEPHNLLDISNPRKSKGEIQLMLAQWYRHQNRYGLAVATAMEALRSFLAPYYLRYLEKENGDCENEETRKLAIQRLDVIAHNDHWLGANPNENEVIYYDIRNLLVKLEKERKNKVAPIRNAFAHNLEEELDMESSRKTIEDFIQDLDQLRGYIRDNSDKFFSVYGYQPSNIPEHEVSLIPKKIFISEEYDIPEECRNILLRRYSTTCELRKLPQKMNQKIKKHNMSPEEIMTSAGWLCTYLKMNCDIQNCQLIFDDSFKQKKLMNYAMLLYANGFNHVFVKKNNLESIPKPVFSIENFDEKEFDVSLFPELDEF